MKQLGYSILGAVVGGFVLFVAQTWYSSWLTNGASTVHFESLEPSVQLRPEKLIEIMTKKKDDPTYDPIQIVVVRVKNTGSQDISEKSFTAKINGAIAVENMQAPTDRKDFAAFKIDADRVTVRYKLFPRNTAHTFWYAAPDFRNYGSPKFSADDPNVSATNKPDYDDSFPWEYLGYAALAFLIFIAGAAAGDTGLRGQLKAKGWDMKELLGETTQVSSTNRP